MHHQGSRNRHPQHVRAPRADPQPQHHRLLHAAAPGHAHPPDAPEARPPHGSRDGDRRASADHVRLGLRRPLRHGRTGDCRRTARRAGAAGQVQDHRYRSPCGRRARARRRNPPGGDFLRRPLRRSHRHLFQGGHGAGVPGQGDHAPQETRVLRHELRHGALGRTLDHLRRGGSQVVGTPESRRWRAGGSVRHPLPGRHVAPDRRAAHATTLCRAGKNCTDGGGLQSLPPPQAAGGRGQRHRRQRLLAGSARAVFKVRPFGGTHAHRPHARIHAGQRLAARCGRGSHAPHRHQGAVRRDARPAHGCRGTFALHLGGQPRIARRLGACTGSRNEWVCVHPARPLGNAPRACGHAGPRPAANTTGCPIQRQPSDRHRRARAGRHAVPRARIPLRRSAPDCARYAAACRAAVETAACSPGARPLCRCDPGRRHRHAWLRSRLRTGGRPCRQTRAAGGQRRPALSGRCARTDRRGNRSDLAQPDQCDPGHCRVRRRVVGYRALYLRRLPERSAERHRLDGHDQRNGGRERDPHRAPPAPD